MSKRMKESGIEWIGEIPEEWDAVNLLKVLKQKITDGPHETPNYVSEGIPFISVDSLGYGESVNFDVVDKFISSSDYESYNKKTDLREGDILFTKSATIGKMAIVDDRKQFMIWSPIAVIKTNNKLMHNKYCYYVMFTEKYIEHVRLLGTSNTQVNVGMRTLEKSMIPLPNFVSDQQKIANFLDQKCFEIDHILKKTRESIEEYKKLKQSIITEAVTKGLDRNVDMKESGVEWIGEIPKHWEVMPHKYIMFKRKELCAIYAGEDILSLTMRGVIKRDLENPSGKMPTSFDGYQKIYKGNLLLCLFDIDVTPRCVGLIEDEGLTSPAYSQFQFLNKDIVKYYYYLLLNIDYTKEFLHLSKNLRSSLTEDDFGDIKTILPPILEQQQISDYLDQKCSEIDSLITQKETLITDLEAYKKSLIFECVTGKREVVYEP